MSELARKVNLPKSTVHRLLQVVEEEGFVCQDLKTSKYLLSVLLFHLGAVARSTMKLSPSSARAVKEGIVLALVFVLYPATPKSPLDRPSALDWFLTVVAAASPAVTPMRPVGRP